MSNEENIDLMLSLTRRAVYRYDAEKNSLISLDDASSEANGLPTSFNLSSRSVLDPNAMDVIISEIKNGSKK